MHSLEHLTQFASMSLVSGIWQGFVLAIAVGLCLRMAPKTPAALRFVIWGVVLVLTAFLPFVEGLATPTNTGTATPLVHVDVRWSLAIALLWLALSLYRAGDLAVHAVKVWSLRRRSVPMSVDAASSALLRTGLRKATICTSAEVERPSVIGFFAPRVLIPGWLAKELTSAELEQIVLHEMEHLHRGDDWLNLLQKLSLVVFPLNPVMLWIERRLCIERELACDDGVLRRTGAPRAYATCLTNLAERGLDRRTLSLALGVAAQQSELGRRVHRILRREASLSPLKARALSAAITMGLLGGAAGLARCPQVVSFSAAQPLTGPQAASQPPVMLPARVNAPAAAEDVVYRPAQAPHISLLKASAPQPVTARVRPVIHSTRRQARRSPITFFRRGAFERVSMDRSADQQWILLTSWSESGRARLVLPVAPADDDHTDFHPYAAVPTPGGWLIVQL
jgi:beta-lactamase regulating signal transducer with metallopeptidase domain